ncbi:hypothetical protein FJZ31_34095 [Candidatus Poribacteria bacterium]|nr:hypothetical protein [Candidatus Poribacteria bacterium]
METTKAIKGKVTNILNKRELAMNVGCKDGVKEKMRFKVVYTAPVKDPDTGEELGEINREKIRVEVFQVEERFSLARTYETYQVNVGGDGILFRPDIDDSIKKIFEPQKIVTRVKTFDDASEFEAMDSKLPIKVGDRVVQILDEPKEMQLGQKEPWTSNKKAEVDAAECGRSTS